MWERPFYYGISHIKMGNPIIKWAFPKPTVKWESLYILNMCVNMLARSATELELSDRYSSGFKCKSLTRALARLHTAHGLSAAPPISLLASCVFNGTWVWPSVKVSCEKPGACSFFPS